MDTNVFISGLKPGDPFHTDSRLLMTGMRNGEIRAETSALTVLEVASVSGRLYHSNRRPAGSEKERKVFVLRALKRLGELKIKFVNVAGDGPAPVKGIQATLPSVFNEGLLLTLRSTLRTLDLIHVAAAKHARLLNADLGAFVTGDREFLSNTDDLAAIVGMPIMSPREYLATFAKSRPNRLRGGPVSGLVRAQRDERQKNLSR